MYSVDLKPEEAVVGTYLVIVAGQGAVTWLRPAEEVWWMSAERPGRVGADRARRWRTNGARWWRSNRTGRWISDGVGLGKNRAMVVLFGWTRGAGWQLRRFEGVNQVHLCEDRRRWDKIELLLWLEHLHFCCIELSEFCPWQMVHDTGTKWVTHHIDGGTHSVTEWTNSIAVSKWNDESHQELNNTNIFTTHLTKVIFYTKKAPEQKLKQSEQWFPATPYTPTPTPSAYQTPDSQQPVDSNQQTDVLGGQADSGQDQQHGHQSCTGNTGSSNTGQSGSHTVEIIKHNSNHNAEARTQKKCFFLTMRGHWLIPRCLETPN